MTKRYHGVNKISAYWWMEQVTQFRNGPVVDQRTNFKVRQEVLKLAMRRSKRKSFLDICDDAEDYSFGMAYKLLTKKQVRWKSYSAKEAEFLNETVAQRFPQHGTMITH